ncbi:MAG: HEPN domain-containing protein [Anaerolineae bacterium]|jgi:uncharacterized protein (UPF0332 family)
MDIETKRTYIGIRVAKAREDLVTAQEMLRLEHWRGAINRAYYAIFHITSATLLWLDIERSKHSGIQAAFNQFLVKPGMIEDEYSQIYKEVRDWREEQDYKDLVRPLDQTATTHVVRDAERFVTRLERYLHQVGAIE